MKTRFFLSLLAFFAVLGLAGKSIALAETINTQDYWALNDGYIEDFTNNGQVVVSYGPYSPYIMEDVFTVDWPDEKGNTHQFFNYDYSGNLKYYGAVFYESIVDESFAYVTSGERDFQVLTIVKWVYVASGAQDFLPPVLEVGKTYTQSWQRDEYKDDEYVGMGSDSYTITVTGPHTTTVPAGTFTTYQLVMVNEWQASTGALGTVSYTYYLAHGIGWVKMIRPGGTYELQEAPLMVSPSSLSLSEGQTGTCTLSGGTGVYSARSGNTAVATVGLNGSTLSVTGVSAGSATITYSDSGGEWGTMSVTVAESYSGPPLSVSPSSLSLSEGQTGTCTLSGGTGVYSARSGNTAVATVGLNGSTLSVTGVSSGSVTVTYSDTGGDSGTVAVTVVASGPLTVSPSSLSLSEGQTGTCTLSGGTGVYGARSENTGIATIGLNGSTISVTGVSSGSATVTYFDNGGDWGTMAISVGGSDSGSGDLAVSPSSLSLSEGQTGTCTLSGGTGVYGARSENTGIATIGLNGSTISVTGVSSGSATVTYFDSGGDWGTMAISVGGSDSGSGDLAVSPSSLSFLVGQTGFCTLTGGTEVYGARSENTSVATTYLSGNTLTVIGVSDGTTTVTYFDSGGDWRTMSVWVGSVYVGLLVNPVSLSLSVGQTGFCTLTSGVGAYGARSENTAVATVGIDGSTLSVTGVSSGSATITYFDSGGFSKTMSVSVSGKLPSTYTNSLGMTFILLPAGTFTMGSPSDEPGADSDEDEWPQHQVTLTQPFYMQQTEVTQAQWEAVMGSSPSYFSGCPTCPVEKVSWDDVQVFLGYMNARGEGTYDLPTEAQWGYAARAGSITAFYNGGITETGSGYDPNLDAIGWYTYNSGSETHPVAQKTPNAWGLYDMTGNVWEWCQDWYSSSYYDSSPSTDPAGPSSGSNRVNRGGSWYSTAGYSRSAFRNYYSPTARYIHLGFRLTRQP
jgi:formylglycine-generating enzyme required for sulfatase activity